MEAFGGQIPPDGIWQIVSWIRAQQAHEGAEKH
jgi:mono/diheme cytochrome c family protein